MTVEIYQTWTTSLGVPHTLFFKTICALAEIFVHFQWSGVTSWSFGNITRQHRLQLLTRNKSTVLCFVSSIGVDFRLLLSFGHLLSQLSKSWCNTVEKLLTEPPQCPGMLLGVVHAIQIPASLLWLPSGYNGTFPTTLLWYHSVDDDTDTDLHWHSVKLICT